MFNQNLSKKMKNTPKVKKATQAQANTVEATQPQATATEQATEPTATEQPSEQQKGILSEYEQDAPFVDEEPAPAKEPAKSLTIGQKSNLAKDYLNKMEKLGRLETSRDELIYASVHGGTNDKFTLEFGGKTFTSSNEVFVDTVFNTLLDFIKKQIEKLEKELAEFSI